MQLRHLVVLALLLSCCRTSPSDQSSAPATPTIGGASAPGPTRADSRSPSQSSCPLWKGAARIHARSSAGRADFFRDLTYEVASGSAQVHDSDPFATGKEEKTPRETKTSRVVAGLEKSSFEQQLFSVCPGEQALQRKCAPGGCLRLEIQSAQGTVQVEDADSVQAVIRTFRPLFPALRW